MDSDRLQQAVQEAANRLRQEGWEARAVGSHLVCRMPRGLEVVIENRAAPGEPDRWDHLLDQLVAAILETAANEADG